jgi:hypothetical protein
VLLRARRRAHDSGGVLDGVRLSALNQTAERALRDVSREARKLLGDR